MTIEEMDAQILVEANGDLTQLDLAVARKITGWHCCENGSCDFVRGDHKGLWTENRDGENWPHGKIQDFAPSSDISAAMKVIENVRTAHGLPDFELRFLRVWIARFDNIKMPRNIGFVANDPNVSPSEVICRAALAALEG